MSRATDLSARYCRVVANGLRPSVRDFLVTGGVLGLGLAGIALAPPHQAGFRDRDILAILLTLGQVCPLLFRRQRPVWVMTAVWAATIAFLALRYPPVSSSFAGMTAATYALASYRPSEDDRLASAVSATLGIGLAAGAVAHGYSAREGLVLLLLLLTAWVMGDRARTRRSYLEALEERSRLLERERTLDLEAAAAAERTRIARELHDVIAHGVSSIVLNARGAREQMNRDPEATKQSLELIEHTGRDALDELRVVLGALRGDNSTDGFEPQQRLSHLDALIARTQAAGLRVDVSVEGALHSIPSAVDLAAYRIVQEALANVMKHSTATRAAVVVRYEHDHLVVQVADEGERRENSVPSGGHGLLGMRERAATLGGRIDAGPRDVGGYEVLAVLPLGSHP